MRSVNVNGVPSYNSRAIRQALGAYTKNIFQQYFLILYSEATSFMQNTLENTLRN